MIDEEGEKSTMVKIMQVNPKKAPCSKPFTCEIAIGRDKYWLLIGQDFALACWFWQEDISTVELLYVELIPLYLFLNFQFLLVVYA